MYYWIIVIILSIAAGIVAKQKNRSVVGWSVGTFLLSPILIILFVLPKKDKS